ncbi:baseplate J/gp47 family protein [Pseudooceanicola sp. CBS1P-1]|uniref:Baseplate assembly protein J n=1 Tax=Pseudooceanicola albus TaxID=2692189 RepID=A0A6L7FYL4_9RHOB|nr:MULTISPECIES: baseplate J/gp47 family protein [Pseudooceanicola]MBT9383329.1 baseplate J/gp47 family protein [Pseudooceanicola endophyticus]MXN16348.1 Baseplate assembly protein J [Pseudooceanicola albus]
MSRYSALDLAALPDPSAIVALDFDAILEARLTELEAQLAEVFDAAKVAEVMALARNIAASPMRYLNEAAAARELYMENRINQAVRSVFLATATGDDLDQIGANRGVVRKVLDDSDADNPVMESDATFRARIQLVIEAWSPHGTEGSYVYWALDADDRVVDVAVYGPNHGLDPAIPPAEPKMVILSSEGDGTADADLLQAVYDNCTVDTRRPVADKLTVISATPVTYSVEAVLYVTSPEAASAVQDAAQAAVEAFAAGRIRIGRKLYRASLAAALNVSGVVDVDVISPAASVEVGPFEAAYCDSITITLQSITGGWRDV